MIPHWMPKPEFDQQKGHQLGIAWGMLKHAGINRLRIASAEESLGRGALLIDAAESVAETTPGLRLLNAQAARALHSYEVIIDACRMGRGVQASMLNRSLLDDVLGLHWAAANQNEAPRRADEHERLIVLAERKLFAQWGQASPLTSEEQRELAGLVKVYGGRKKAYTADWHRASHGECREIIKQRWSRLLEAAERFDWLYDVVQRQNNLLLHGSPSAFRQTLHFDQHGRVSLNRAGPDSRWRFALKVASVGFSLAIRVTAEEFELDPGPCVESLSRTADLCREIEGTPQVMDLSSAAPCPCGSGWLVSDCHRS